MPISIKETEAGNFLTVQWLGLGTFTVQAQGLIPGHEAKDPMSCTRPSQKN